MAQGNIISKLQSMKPSLNGAYRTICTYVLEHRAQVPSMSTEELARACDVSEATVVRFARKIGAAGYRDFKLSLSAANAMGVSRDTAIADIRTDDPTDKVVDKLLNYTVNSLESTCAVLDRGELARAVDIIDRCHALGGRIHLAGLGATSVVVRAFAVKLMRIGIDAVYFPDFHLQLESMLAIEPKDVLVCFTVLGRSVENEQLIEIARNQGCEVVIVTQQGAGKLEKAATCLLQTSCVENNLRLASQTALIVMMLIVDMLFTLLALRHIDSTQDAVDASRRMFYQLGHYTN